MRSARPPPHRGGKMTSPPPCPQKQDFSVLHGFITPGSDTTPHALDASITAGVLDPPEGGEQVRIVETTAPWGLEVDCCVCGRFSHLLSGRWCGKFLIAATPG